MKIAFIAAALLSAVIGDPDASLLLLVGVMNFWDPKQIDDGQVQASSGRQMAVGDFSFDQARQMADWARLMGDELMGDARANSAEAMGHSRFFMDRYKNVFAPNEDRLAKDIAAYDSPEKMDQLRQEAAGNVAVAGDVAAKSRGVELARMGVNPNSGRYGEDRSLQLGRTMATADAMNRSTAGREDAAIGLRGGLAQYGSAMPGISGQFATQGAGFKNAAANVAGGLRLAPAQFVNSALAGYRGSSEGMLGLQRAYTDSFREAQVAHHNFNQDAQGWTNIAMSSEKVKNKVGRVIEGDVVRKIKTMPVDRWRYKDEIVQDKAEDGAQREHIGPYAGDFQRRFGVGDGKHINLIDAVGVAFAAVKGLAKDIDKLKAAAAAA